MKIPIIIKEIYQSDMIVKKDISNAPTRIKRMLKSSPTVTPQLDPIVGLFGGAALNTLINQPLRYLLAGYQRKDAMLLLRELKKSEEEYKRITKRETEAINSYYQNLQLILDDYCRFRSNQQVPLEQEIMCRYIQAARSFYGSLGRREGIPPR